jgi:ribosomal protein S27E
LKVRSGGGKYSERDLNMILSIKCNNCGHWQILFTENIVESKPKCRGCGKTISCYGAKGINIDYKQFNSSKEAVGFCSNKNSEGISKEVKFTTPTPIFPVQKKFFN